MQTDGPAWDDARRAWRRLSGGTARRGRAGGDDALVALSDIGVVRRILDQAELTAVRAARRHGRPWAEIATNLGITRQSAWEKWRDLDETPDEAAARVKAEAVASVSSTVAVPDVIGLSVDDAAQLLRRAGLKAVEHAGGGATVPLRPETAAVVSDQVPRGGAERRRGSTVSLWLERGGGSAGVREPRRPRPSPRAGVESRDIA